MYIYVEKKMCARLAAITAFSQISIVQIPLYRRDMPTRKKTRINDEPRRERRRRNHFPWHVIYG